MTVPALELRGIVKRFGPVQALRGADFTLRAGEVHALLGENGAGKSTLMHVAYGLLRPDAGTIVVRGRTVMPRSPRDARRLGIGMVHQHFTSVPALTVAENIALTAGWGLSPRALRERVLALTSRVGLPLDPDARADTLPVAAKQRLEIVKALAADATILLLDEPTAVLAPSEADEVIRVIRGFATEGGSAVLITHKLDEALRAADRVTALRAGRVTLTGVAAEQTPESLARAMIGSDPPSRRGPARRAVTEQPVLVRCEMLDLSREDGRGIAIRGASLAIGAGEIVGVAAVEGNGQRELLRAVGGLVRPLRGRLDVSGPVAFIPEDRTSEGLIGELALTDNVVLGLGRTAPWVHSALIDWNAARQRTAAIIREFGIRTPGPDTPAGVLSGGNQQKVVIARALELLPRVIVAENPTRGLDVLAAADVWDRLAAAAVAGAAVLVHATDLDELLDRVDRTLVVAQGIVTPAPDGAGKTEVGAMMLGARGSLPA
ncbi:MAG TPA: ATP-binding cassette domain-containing protein [Gemmatimonadales bacterium]